jgi:bifunctional non-homologous end joining protein LigD
VASLAQMAVLEVHPWGSLARNLEKADRLTFDLDPDEALDWKVLTGAVIEARDRLAELGLESFVKTTGGKGLHVVVPIVAEMEWPQVKEFCHQFVLDMEKSNPRLYLTKMTKAARTGKIYLDYLRNERGATAVAPYSPRARANVGVAMPLDWTELKAETRPIYRVGNFAEWGGRLKDDAWEGFFQVKQKIGAKAKKAVGMQA